MENIQNTNIIIKIDGSTVYIIDKDTNIILQSYQVINGSLRGEEQEKVFFGSISLSRKTIYMNAEYLEKESIRFGFFSDNVFKLEIKKEVGITINLEAAFDQDLGEYVATFVLDTIDSFEITAAY